MLTNFVIIPPFQSHAKGKLTQSESFKEFAAERKRDNDTLRDTSVYIFTIYVYIAVPAGALIKGRRSKDNETLLLKTS